MSEKFAMHDLRTHYRVLSIRAAACVLFFFLSIWSSHAQGRPDDSARRGQELARRVLQAQDTSGFQMRARVLLGAGTDDTSPVLQVRIAGRRDPGVTRILYQILWPKSQKGLAAVLERRPRSPIGGILFEPPGRVTRLTPAFLGHSFAGTGLTLEDLAEDFWRWPVQRVTGKGRAGERSCTILESRPSPDTASSYSVVRSCIVRSSALWVEKLDADNKIAKRINFESPDRKKGSSREYRLAMVVEGTGLPRTRIEFLKSDRDIVVAPDVFSVERLKALANNAP